MTAFLDAMVLCAGLGTRLRPLTLERAKPAVPLLNRPLVGYALGLVKGLGLQRATINTHWLPDTMQQAAQDEAQRWGLQLGVSHEPQLLDTGGGLWEAREKGLLKRIHHLLVLNGDVVFDADLERLWKVHRDTKAKATMVLRPMPPGASYSPLEAESDGRIRRIGKWGTPVGGTPSMFSGIHILSPEALDLLPPGKSGVIEHVYARLLERGERVQAVMESGLWLDLGDPQGYLDAHLQLLSGTQPLGALERHGVLTRAPDPIADTARLGEGARLVRTTVGPGAAIGAGAELVDCVVWEGAQVHAGERLERTIVTQQARVAVGR